MPLAWWQYAFYAFSVAIAIVNFMKDWIWVPKPIPISNILNRTLYTTSTGSLQMTFPGVRSGTLILTESSGSYGTYQWLLGNKNSTLLGCVSPTQVCTNEGTMQWTDSINGYTWIAPSKLAQRNFTATILFSS
jgi:hypothetical protein